jgi:hypothetical protein
MSQLVAHHCYHLLLTYGVISSNDGEDKKRNKSRLCYALYIHIVYNISFNKNDYVTNNLCPSRLRLWQCLILIWQHQEFARIPKTLSVSGCGDLNVLLSRNWMWIPTL